MKIKNFLLKIWENKFSRNITIGVSCFLLLYLSCFNYLDYTHVGIKRNIFTGSLEIDSIPGMEISAPWVQIARIDTRPTRICIDCSCRNLNCQLVSFNPSGWKDFVDREGFRYYWWSNRISFNFGNEHEYRGMRNIIRGYSFDEKFSFIKKSENL